MTISRRACAPSAWWKKARLFQTCGICGANGVTVAVPRKRVSQEFRDGPPGNLLGVYLRDKDNCTPFSGGNECLTVSCFNCARPIFVSKGFLHTPCRSNTTNPALIKIGM